MPYVAISNNIKNINSLSLSLMSAEEMINMSYGEVLTAETINYRTGAPQMNGLFCQAIFGPVKDWECACGKYKRFRYAGVICDKCGVEVTHTSVRRERMGHIALAAPCVHPWFSRIVPSRIALALDMKSVDINKITYFSSYVVTSVNENLREEYIQKIQLEKANRLQKVKNIFEGKFDDLSRDYQKLKSKSAPEEGEKLRMQYEMQKDILKEQAREAQERINTTAENALVSLEGIKIKDVMNENRYYELSHAFAAVFKAQIGADAVNTLLKDIDLPSTIEQLKVNLENSKGQARKKIAKRLKLLKSFEKNQINLDSMVLKAIMVLPPELRPMLQLDGGRFAHADLNDLYRRLINRNNRLRKLIQIGAPEVILRNEKRMLQEAVEALIDNSAKGGRQVMAATGAKRPLKSLTDVLKGKQGRFRQNLLGKRVDYSGRSVIIIGPTLKLDECGLPKEMALELFKPFLIGNIIAKSEAGTLPEEYQAFNVHSARRLVESKMPIIYDILEEVISDKYVLLNRAPTLHRLSFRAFKPTLVDGKAITLHPLVCSGFNADFDGDQMAVHIPITAKAQEEARTLIAASKNLVKVADGGLTTGFSQDILLGLYYLTKINDTKTLKTLPIFGSEDQALASYDYKKIDINQLIKVRIKKNNSYAVIETSVGRIIFNRKLPFNTDFVNNTLDKKAASKLLNNLFFEYGQDRLALMLDDLKDLGFKYATKSGISMSMFDIVVPDIKNTVVQKGRDEVEKLEDLYTLGLMTREERSSIIQKIWEEAGDSLNDKIEENLKNSNDSVSILINSGARGSLSNLSQMAGMRGMSRTSTGKIMELCVTHNYFEGVTGLEYFINSRGGRKSLADIALKTADAGYLTRRLVDVAQNIIIAKDDCGTVQSIEITKIDSDKHQSNIIDRIYGRFTAAPIVVDGKEILGEGVFIDNQVKKELAKYNNIESVFVRAVTTCELHRGVCQKCFGMDFSTHSLVEMGSAVGIIAAQSLGEPSTQLTMKSKIEGAAVSSKKADITSGLPRVEEIFEARNPKTLGTLSPLTGVVKTISGSIDNGYTILFEEDKQKREYKLLPHDMRVLEEGARVEIGDTLYIRGTGEIVTAKFNGAVSYTANTIILSSVEVVSQEVTSLPGYQSMVKKGEKVLLGEKVIDGSAVLQDIIDIGGLDALRNYVVDELLQVYNASALSVNEKHIEVIIKQMASKVQVIDPGASDMIAGDVLSYTMVQSINKNLRLQNEPIITFKRVVVGISKASLSTDSFLSAASFQETSRVLVEAVITGKSDNLTGLKENVILGQLVPVGTGFREANFNVEDYAEFAESLDEE
jgi:DNA-directed RNA polymerase subunit beta'